VESAKTAAGFEFLGTLTRVCLLPQSGGENTRTLCLTTSRSPRARPRGTLVRGSGKVFDNLYFVGGNPLVLA